MVVMIQGNNECNSFGIRHSIENTCISLVGVGIAVEVVMVEEGRFLHNRVVTQGMKEDVEGKAGWPGHQAGAGGLLPRMPRGMLIGPSQLLHFFFFQLHQACDLSSLTRGLDQASCNGNMES